MTLDWATPPECDLRGYRFMPLDVITLRDSDLMAEPDDVFKVNVIAWCVAWHQVPAGSLPNDDVKLARLMGFGNDLRGWKKVRSRGGLRGFVLNVDNRLYHKLVCEKAIEAWKFRKTASESGKAGADKRWKNKETKDSNPNGNPNGNAISGATANPNGVKMAIDSTVQDKTKRSEGGAAPKAAAYSGTSAGTPKADYSGIFAATIPIIAAFDEAIVRHHGAASARMAPHPQDKTTVKAWLEAGADPDTCIAVAAAVVQRMAGAGKRPLKAMSALNDDIADAVAAGRRGLNGHGRTGTTATTTTTPADGTAMKIRAYRFRLERLQRGDDSLWDQHIYGAIPAVNAPYRTCDVPAALLHEFGFPTPPDWKPDTPGAAA